MFPLMQYGTYFYMYLLILITIPAFILGVMEKNIKVYGMIATIFMILAILGFKKHLIFFIIFMIWEVALVYIYLAIRKRTENVVLYRICLFLSMLPIIVFEITKTFDIKLSIGHAMFLGHRLSEHNIVSLGVLTFVGLSYLNFRVLQVIIETYDGTITKLKFFDFIYYVTFFPAFSSGPIDRSRRFEDDLNKKINRNTYLNEYALVGFRKVLVGMLYKFIIAYLIHTYWIEKIPYKITLLHGWNYMYAYALYLFFNFAGYSLMAVGVSYLFGIKTPDNFNKPFISKDMKLSLIHI